MTLQEYLSYITTTKYALNDIFDSILDVSSYAFNQYPDLCYNCLTKRYNDGYRDGYTYASGTTYSGDKRALKTVTAASTSWQGNDYSDYSTLVNIMSAVADIREQMRTVLGTSSNQFVTYPSVLTNGMAAQYNAGYAQGQTDGTQTEPPVKVATPVIELVTDNLLNISSSNATSLRIWVSNTSGGQPMSGSTTLNVSGNSTQYAITGNVNNKYLCAMGMASGLTNSDIASQQLTYVEPSVPEEDLEVPDAPTWYRNPTENVVHISSAEGTVIYYTISGGEPNINSETNDFELPIPTRGIASGNLRVYCKLLSNGQISNTITWNTSTDGSLDYYTAPVTPEPVPASQAETPFWLKITNTSVVQTLTSNDGHNKIQVSTSPEFTTPLVPTVVDGKDNFDIAPEVIYYIRAIETAENLDGYAKKLSITYTGGQYVTLGGNINSLVYGSSLLDTNNRIKTAPDNAFYKGSKGFFVDSNWKYCLTDISQMFFPSCGGYSYTNMFYGCTSLVNLPEEMFNDYSKTIGAGGCKNMFMKCSSITRSPKLCATTIGANAYSGMFSTCTSLSTAGDIEATTLGTAQEMQWMFNKCTNLITGPSELKPLSLKVSSYDSMFNNCTKLREAPIIRARNITSQSCLNSMFTGCSNLIGIEVHFITWPTGDQTSEWVRGVSSNGVFTKGSECTWDVEDHVGVSGIPEGWIIEEES